ncbi:MAG: hypothetical protein IKV83_02695 [Muribaculaceae bacterium]|nr:hypothetical protein [Muribaculaceae bacterium]
MKTTSKILIAFVALTWVCTIILFGIEHEKSQKNSSNNDIYITAIDSSFTSISPNIKVLQIDKTGNNWWGDIRITPTYSKTNASVSIPDYLLNYVNIKQQNDTTILTLNIPYEDFDDKLNEHANIYIYVDSISCIDSKADFNIIMHDYTFDSFTNNGHRVTFNNCKINKLIMDKDSRSTFTNTPVKELIISNDNEDDWSISTHLGTYY